jgi:hypothetical protein
MSIQGLELSQDKYDGGIPGQTGYVSLGCSVEATLRKDHSCIS